MVCTRSMQFTLKRVNGTFKTLEGNLVIDVDGQRKSISTRCADLDAQMPVYLGVSKAVLDNVIFCHQEESLWPLSEPSVLKKKFDEIFEALKFTKVLDNIKTLRKDYATDIKLQNADTEHLQANKERAERMEQKAQQLLDEIERYKEEAQKLEEEIQLITEESNELFSSNQKFQKILYELESLRHEHTAGQDAIERLVNSIEILNDSDEQLTDKLNNFEEQAAELVREQDVLRNKLTQAKNVLDSLQGQYHDNIQQQGKLKAEQDSYKSNISARQTQLIELATKFGLDQNGTYQQTSEALANLAETYKGNLEAERTSNLRNENEMNKIISDITTDKLREEQKVISLRNNVRESEVKTRKLQLLVDEIQVDEGTLAYRQQLIQSQEQKLTTTQEALNQINNGKQIPMLEAQLKEIDSNKDRLNHQLTIVNAESETRSKLKFLSDDAARRVAAQNAVIERHKHDFNDFGIDLSQSIDGRGIEKALRDAIEVARNSLDSSLEEQSKAKQKVTQVEMRLNLAREELKKVTKEIMLIGDTIEPVLGVRSLTKEEYEAKIAGLIEEEVQMNERVQQLTSFEQTARAALGKAESEHLCFICQRKFDDLEGLKAFEARLQQIIHDIEQAKIAESEDNTGGNPLQKLEDAQEKLRVTRSVLPDVTRLIHLINEVQPKLEKTIVNLGKDLTEAQAIKNQMELLVEDANDASARVEVLRRAAADMARAQQEIASVKDQIRDLEIGLDINSSEDKVTMSSSEILDLLAVETEKFKKYRKQLDDLMAERDRYQTQISNLQHTIAEKRVEIQKVEKQLEEKHNDEQQIKAERERIIVLKREISEVTRDIESIDARLKEQKSELDAVKIAGTRREKEISGMFTAVQDAIADVRRTNVLIERYEKSSAEADLASCDEMIKTIGAHLAATKEKQEELSAQINEGEKTILDLKGHKRTLEDNLNLRQLRKEAESRLARMAELENMNAERDRDRYEQESSRLRNKHARLSAQLAGKMGEVKQLDDQLRQINEELDTDYKTVVDDYRAAVIKLRATTVANEDLAKYSKALEAAIMKYHTMKMAEVNEIIDELWKKTYSGSDVDTILIRSDSETTSKTGTSKYNYRVCMVKQDVELDMRGRCSAGQKVLASIIIRLALAQCFGVNCGLIALDEPTTNLDSDNIESLAKALSLIISTRREQRNFQLIVITHDEKFLTHMNAAAYTDHFFRVSRNERQKSQIEWVPISRVVE